ncbi:MAG: BASS family bile acid:Na+ symporter [Parasphingorhabdus sp.]|jgi:BASS family bile acid:Na+ symporter
MQFRQLLLACSVFVALLLPDLAAFAAPALLPSLFIIMLLSLMNMNWQSGEIFQKSEWLSALAIVLFQMIVLPLVLVLVLSSFLKLETVWFAGLILSGSTIFGASAFAGLLGLSSTLTLLGVLMSTLLMPFSLLFMWWLIGSAELDMSVVDYSQRIALFMVVPAILAWIYHLGCRRFNWRNNSNWIQHGVVLALIVFALAIMDGVTDFAMRDPLAAVQMFLLVLIIHLGLFGLSWLTFRFKGSQVAMIAGMLSANRNLGMLMAVAGSMVPENFLLFVGLWQIPMYLSPLVLGFVLSRSKVAQKVNL